MLEKIFRRRCLIKHASYLKAKNTGHSPMALKFSNRRNTFIVVDKILQLPIIRILIRYRFSKFGVVGFSGTVVNFIVLYINQEIIFKDIYPRETRLNLSLEVAIFLATINNYLWNRNWTWSDRKGKKNMVS
jgi:hypothetical protein